jgi:Ni,Fe-hydrogenase I cytochrome b subunit
MLVYLMVILALFPVYVCFTKKNLSVLVLISKQAIDWEPVILDWLQYFMIERKSTLNVPKNGCSIANGYTM